MGAEARLRRRKYRCVEKRCRDGEPRPREAVEEAVASEGRRAEPLCTAGTTQVSGERLASPFGRRQAANPLLKEQGSVWVGPRLQEQEAQHKVVSTGFPPRGPSNVIRLVGTVRAAPRWWLSRLNSDSWLTAKVTSSLLPPALASRVSHRNFLERYELLRRLCPGVAPSPHGPPLDEGRSGEGAHLPVTCSPSFPSTYLGHLRVRGWGFRDE